MYQQERQRQEDLKQRERNPINVLRTPFQTIYLVAKSALEAELRTDQRYIVSTTLEDADFSHADLTNAELKRAILRNATFNHAVLAGIHLTQRQIRQAILEPANEPNSNLE